MSTHTIHAALVRKHWFNYVGLTDEPYNRLLRLVFRLIKGRERSLSVEADGDRKGKILKKKKVLNVVFFFAT